MNRTQTSWFMAGRPALRWASVTWPCPDAPLPMRPAVHRMDNDRHGASSLHPDLGTQKGKYHGGFFGSSLFFFEIQKRNIRLDLRESVPSTPKGKGDAVALGVVQHNDQQNGSRLLAEPSAR
ncbi:hypothetical protein PAPYR_10011 [Paratrimastix pyriformis]|uniref:Uncharacterized protein n=1 Tax=Paratrimastix pyriformis TaxID=342808 RepID=A0ABQ8U9R9_9EUKA|nr:hypothetical protein PAPYR_10011 [Paratrimastix pyriformis]